jgi:hypothetical protein
MNDKEMYKQTFDAAINELSALMEQREELDNRREELNVRIAQVRTGILALSPLVGEEPESVENKYPHLFPDLIQSDMGLTDAVRKVLQSNGKLLTAVGVRTGLRTIGYDIDRYKNVLASIHTILKRLAESDEVETGTINDTTAYKWKKKTVKMPNQGVGDIVKPRPVPPVRSGSLLNYKGKKE